MLALLAVFTLFICAHAESPVESISSQGYPAEIHYITTKDSYILELVRIKRKKCTTSNGKVALFVHGTGGCYNSFTHLGSKYGAAYNFADAGYDVWMMNARGNSFSRRHKCLDPDRDSKQFFNFSFEEIGLYDLPATIDYVLAITNEDKLHYIGHSQGGTVFFVLNSMIPAYQSKIASAHLLGAVGYQKVYPNEPGRLFCSAVDVIYSLTLRVDFVELKPSLPLTGVLIESFVNSTVPKWWIAGASVKQIAHYCQAFRDESFRRWNYGAAKNLLKYGSTSPPKYDLTKIKVNTTLIYSDNDITQNVTELMDTVKAMPNARAYRVARGDFDHMDYVRNTDVKKLVIDHIIEWLKNY